MINSTIRSIDEDSKEKIVSKLHLQQNDDVLINILLKYLPVFLSWKDKENIYLGCNEAFAKLHDKDSIDEIIDKTDHDLYQPNIVRQLNESDQKTIQSKQSSVSEERLETLNNKKIDVLTHRVPIFQQQELAFILCVSIDITHLIKQQNDLKDAFQNIITILPEHVYWKDANGVILGCNDQQARSVGLQSHLEMIGKTPYDTLPKEQADSVHNADMQIIKTGIAQTVVEESSKHDGSIATYESRKVPLFDPETNEITGLVGISFDITERIQAQEREKIAIQKASEEKIKADAEANLRSAVTVLAGSIAHDLRVPLTSMSIMLDLFSKFWTAFLHEHKQLIVPQNVDIMQMHLERLDSFPIKIKKIINDMNDFISVTLKSMQHLVAGTLSYEDFTISEIEHCVKDAIAAYPYKNDEKELIHINIDYNFEFLGYPVLFYRVIFNLIRNSLEQFEKNGKGEIYITTDQSEKFNLLRYKDTAGGASPEIVASLFDGYKTTKKEGTGVGLAFCKLTMQSFDGDITCRSVEGDYIEFTLSFPKLDIY